MSLNPTKEKYKILKNMQIPKYVNALKTFVGTVNYLAKFIPNLSTKTISLRALEKN